jgi:hypothetical protein
MMEYTSKLVGFRLDKEKKGTKNAKGVEGLGGGQKKKRKELASRMWKEANGTGTQIVHSDIHCG